LRRQATGNVDGGGRASLFFFFLVQSTGAKGPYLDNIAAILVHNCNGLGEKVIDDDAQALGAALLQWGRRWKNGVV
jgi:hypothetical protein